MSIPVDRLDVIDNGGTRSGRGRRKLKNINFTPERRMGQERRNGADRRKNQIYRGDLAIERRENFRGHICNTDINFQLCRNKNTTKYQR
jgi:hypothetical protein